jgi:rhodanese-related sulfurtransferase
VNLLRSIFGGTKEISPDNYRAKFQSHADNVHVLLDVRNHTDYEKEHIDGALNIPLNKLNKKLKALPHDQPIVCVCWDGLRSREATFLLKNAGYNASYLVGGVKAWRREGGDVVR